MEFLMDIKINVTFYVVFHFVCVFLFFLEFPKNALNNQQRNENWNRDGHKKNLRKISFVLCKAIHLPVGNEKRLLPEDVFFFSESCKSLKLFASFLISQNHCPARVFPGQYSFFPLSLLLFLGIVLFNAWLKGNTVQNVLCAFELVRQSFAFGLKLFVLHSFGPSFIWTYRTTERALMLMFQL